MNWTEFLETSFVATILVAVQVWFARGGRVARPRRDAVDAAQLAVALETLGAPSSLCDQARAESMVADRRALSTAKPSWIPSVLGFLSILVLAWVATQVLPNAAESLWSWSMFGVALAIAVLAWGVEWLCRWVGGRFVRVPDNLSKSDHALARATSGSVAGQNNASALSVGAGSRSARRTSARSMRASMSGR